MAIFYCQYHWKRNSARVGTNETEVLPEDKFLTSVLLLVQMASVYFYHYKSLTVGVMLSPISCFMFIDIITVLETILITQFFGNIWIGR